MRGRKKKIPTSIKHFTQNGTIRSMNLADMVDSLIESGSASEMA